MDYKAFLNKITLRRNPTVLRQIFDSLGVDENYVLMAGGLPNPDVFPIRTADFQLSDGSTVTINESEMRVAQQYGTTAGLPALREFIKNLLVRFHDPPLMREPDHPGTPYIVCTAGSQDGIYKVFECIADEEDTILMNEPAYPAVMSVLAPIGCNVVGIKTDKNGIIPEHLAEVLSKWKRPDDDKPARDSKGGKLKALYVIPNAGNPSGLRYTLERKQEIYRLAQEYNFLIIEDEAYFFLEKKPFTKSFLSLDVDGRVLRLDTFSKTIGPGFRIASVTGPVEITKKIRYIAMASTLGCSVISQVILMKVLEKWGLDGYIAHCERLAEFYEKRRIQCMELVDKHLKGLVEYDAPSGGMFLWLKCHVIKDTMDLCINNLIKRKVLMVAGSAFLVNDSLASQYIRVSFTLAPLEQLDRGLRILAEELRALTGQTPQINGN